MFPFFYLLFFFFSMDDMTILFFDGNRNIRLKKEKNVKMQVTLSFFSRERNEAVSFL